MMPSSSQTAVDAVAERAAAVAPEWAATELRVRAAALAAVADALVTGRAELVATAIEETGLSQARLDGELTRTAVQLRMFAEVIVDGAYLDVRIDEFDPDFALGMRPDLRRYRIPVGPVVNFAASNFPFAFSVLGGDTASALAAGCPVIVKGHPGHPRLSEQTLTVAVAALATAGAPAGTLQLVMGELAEIELLNHSLIAAASFTGSLRAGRMLADIAAARPAPIPFFGELGSLNPVFVTAGAIASDSQGIASGFVASVSGSAGQLCTKPGLLFRPAGHGLTESLAEHAEQVAEHRMLYPGIAKRYAEQRERILSMDAVTVIAAGTFREDDRHQSWVTPTLVRVRAADLNDVLLAEVFGPFSVVAEYEPDENLAVLAATLFDGNLTSTIHRAAGEDGAPLRALIDVLVATSGRLLFGGWPTGVAVTPAMQHGGPWPATTNDSGTSVGSAAISRFQRAITYQSAQDDLLPQPLRDSNPWKVPQARHRAGDSERWLQPFV